MSKIITQTEEQIKNIVANATDKAIACGELPNAPVPMFTVQIPSDRNHGDYSVNAAMTGARSFKMPPQKIAEIMVKHFDFNDTFIESTQIAGGFINFKIKDRFYAAMLEDISENGENYGKSDLYNGKKVLVEFVSANPTGPMHIGNARGGALGDGIASLLSMTGYETHREFYINDSGNQMEKLANSLNVRYLQLFDESIEMPEDAYHGEDITEHAKNFERNYGDKFVKANEDERKNALVDYALPINIQTLHDDLLAYRIKYDLWFRESTVHKSGDVERVIQLLKESGYTYESEGALWFKATDFGCEKDFVLVRSNGIPTYVVPDIAYHYNKLVVRGFDLCINVLGADHHGYISRLSTSLKALGYGEDRLRFMIYQMVRLVRDGVTVKASKRTGGAITLATLLDEVPVDAARFFFNMREPNTHFDFDLDLAIEQSADNPVFYVQYAHARICSIIRNLASENIEKKNLTIEELSVLTTPEEKELIRHLGAYSGEIIKGANELNPSVITRYTLELAAKFHKFYNSCRVKGETDEILYPRLYLCDAVKSVLKNALSLLKIDAPEAM